MKRRWALAAAAVAALCCGAVGAGTPAAGVPVPADSRGYIVLAVDNPVHRVPRRAGSSLPTYGPQASYGVGGEAAAALQSIERSHGLTPVAAWPIQALGWQCVVFGVPPGAEREALLQALTRDTRVRLAQPLQDFSVLADEAPGEATSVPAPVAADAASPVQYDDPYVDLQRGFVQTAAAKAHRFSTGRGMTVAVVDTGVDSRHPDLRGRVALRQDAVGPDAAAAPEQDRHGTEVAGVIAAAANNRQGIVGIAPDAQLHIHRACWYGAAGGTARCNSFTLAKALAAVLESDARIVNLSLGGPADPLLEALLRKLLEQRRVVVGALPPSGRRDGFPAGVPGVVVVGNAGVQAPVPDVLSAPGRDVLTLVPGGRYDFSSGSSIAAAHVSGIAALLLALDPQLDGPAVQRLLATPADLGAPVNAERAVAALIQRLRWTAAAH